ncbi:hypothetical protein LX32DRAFT_184199 [Colletotrichum zoysiae]|uniref:Uncharacterized protein n=1 Tax=Colletotrichum zoysiae TaxID=1216348 RepID=A0AAD9H6F8_9PEZI|nr:hypothetical protein LX32DRAFT_184199 [Colletotrichum zoysiae]
MYAPRIFMIHCTSIIHSEIGRAVNPASIGPLPLFDVLFSSSSFSFFMGGGAAAGCLVSHVAWLRQESCN